MSGPTYQRVRRVTWPCRYSPLCAGNALPSGGGNGTYCAKHKPAAR